MVVVGGREEKESILYFKCSHEELIQFISDPRTVKHSNSRSSTLFLHVPVPVFIPLNTQRKRDNPPNKLIELEIHGHVGE